MTARATGKGARGVQGIICFTSDFGSSDTWVGICHAIVYGRCPSAHVVDLAHDIAPYDVRRAAAIAASGVWQLPEAIHLVVVDPGVGGPRRDLAIVTGSGTTLIGPDNGVLIPATWRSGGVDRAYSIAPDLAGQSEPLRTFHARDVLAPAAASIACGEDASALGDPVDADSLAQAPFARAREDSGGLVAEVIDIDRFGSARIAISAEDMTGLDLDAGRLEIGFGHAHVDAPVGRTFSDVAEGEPVALVDSSGWLTLAVRLGSAAERYGVEPGLLARVRAGR